MEYIPAEVFQQASVKLIIQRHVLISTTGNKKRNENTSANTNT